MPRRSDAEAVRAWLSDLDPAWRPLVDALRAAIISAGPVLSERIKWNAPSYHLDGIDLGAMNLRELGRLRLVIVYPNSAPAERFGLLEGDWPDRRIMGFSSPEDIAAKSQALSQVIADWLARA
ncbi:MAG: DUF1801 domain-containing protein [Devosia sp.]